MPIDPQLGALIRAFPALGRIVLILQVVVAALTILYVDGIFYLLLTIFDDPNVVLILIYPVLFGSIYILWKIVHFRPSKTTLGHWIRRRWTIRFRKPSFLNGEVELPGSGNLQISGLCKLCANVVNDSRLLRGSPWIIVPTLEHHKFHRSLNDLIKSANDMCHMCELIHQCIEPSKLPELVAGECRLIEETQMVGSRDTDEEAGLLPLTPDALQLQIRIREAIPSRDDESTSSRTFMELARHGELLGGKLLIAEGTKSWDSPVVTAMNTGADCFVDQIQKWISECQNDHPQCSRNHAASMPTRLLFVGDDKNQGTLRLYYPDPRAKPQPYLALSHCWGGASIFSLTSENHDELCQTIDLGCLPKNFQDSISVTRRLGISFIWIDSLCIVQDSAEDWRKESAQMHDIYSDAVCTLAAAASENPSGGCFRNIRPLIHYPVSLINESKWTVDIVGPHMDTETIFQKDVNESPLNQRGWTFQERTMSSRVVHFGAKSIIFECNAKYASNFDPGGQLYSRSRYLKRDGSTYTQAEADSRQKMSQYLLYSQGYHKYVGWKFRKPPRDLVQTNPNFRSDAEIDNIHDDARFGYRGSLDTLLSQTGAQDRHDQLFYKLEYNRRWYDIVSMYSARQLTRGSDKLIAQSGVMSKISIASGLTPCAGLWRENILYNLLWKPVGRPKPRPQEYRAPSWSWASTDSQVCHLFSTGTTLCRDSGSFHPEDLRKWKLDGQEAEVVEVRASLLGQDISDPGAGGFDCISISLSGIQLLKVSLDKDNFRSVDTSISGKYNLDVILDEGVEVAYLARLCAHKDRKSVVHGLVLVPTGTADTSPDGNPLSVVYQKVGTFALSRETVFENRGRETIRIV